MKNYQKTQQTQTNNNNKKHSNKETKKHPSLSQAKVWVPEAIQEYRIKAGLEVSNLWSAKGYQLDKQWNKTEDDKQWFNCGKLLV